MKNMVESIIVSALYLLSEFSVHQRITGKTGKTQGASIVSIHAINDKIIRVKVYCVYL
jgi:hypothetical protein